MIRQKDVFQSAQLHLGLTPKIPPESVFIDAQNKHMVKIQLDNVLAVVHLGTLLVIIKRTFV